MLEPYLGKSKFTQHGQRVVEGQRLMQAASDIMLGWVRTPESDGAQRDFYIRQLWDGKGSPAIEAMEPSAMVAYAELSRRHRLRTDCGANRGDPPDHPIRMTSAGAKRGAIPSMDVIARKAHAPRTW